MTSELYHHGILGQKWGVRRYQNSDGTLTDEGKQHAGYQLNSDGTILKKGSIIKRFGRADESEYDGHSKYGFLTKDDEFNYSEQWVEGYLSSSSANGLYYEYVANKDLTIATGKDVVNYVTKKYGDKHVRDIAKKALDNHDINIYDKLDQKEKNESYNVRHFLNEKMYRNAKTAKEIREYFNKNYDLMVDAEDWITNSAELPLIVLNPKESITTKFKGNYY